MRRNSTAKFILEIAELRKKITDGFMKATSLFEDLKFSGVKKWENLFTVLRLENIIGNTDTEESKKDLNSLRKYLTQTWKWILQKI